MQLTDSQKAQQIATFEQLLRAGAYPEHVLSLVSTYIDALVEIVALKLKGEEADLTRAYIQHAEEYRHQLKKKYLID